MLDFLAFSEGLLVGLIAEAAIGFLVTANLTMWWLKRKAPAILEDLLDDKELMGKLRKTLINGSLGSLLGGRPKNLEGLAMQIGAPIVQNWVEKSPIFIEKRLVVRIEVRRRNT